MMENTNISLRKSMNSIIMTVIYIKIKGENERL